MSRWRKLRQTKICKFERWELIKDGELIACIDYNGGGIGVLRDDVEWEYWMDIYEDGPFWFEFPDTVTTLKERKAYVAAMVRMS